MSKRLTLLWFSYLFNFDSTAELPLSGVWTYDSSREGKARDHPSRRQGARDWAVGLRRCGSLSCVCVLFEGIFDNKQGMTWIRTDRTLHCFYKATYCGLVQCCRNWHFYTTELCECVRVISLMKFSNSLTLSSLALFVIYRVFAPSCHSSSN